jgi:hypothetical protein
MSGPELILYQGHCFHHLHNTWFEAIENNLSHKLTDCLRHDLEVIPLHLCISCKISDLLHQVADWKERFRPDKKYLPPIRVFGGN